MREPAPRYDSPTDSYRNEDRYLYCLAARDGTLLRKLHAGPDDDLVLGNGRMVSRWVVRGGPAVRDGAVYFGAGIWPTDEVYMYPVDAQTGEILWCNDDAAALEIDQPHMGAYSRAGVAAQGYLAVTSDKVFVPTGCSVPAAFDRATGRSLYFHLSLYAGKTPWGVGGGDVAATAGHLYASTRKGTIYCLGAKTADGTSGVAGPRPETSRYPRNGPAGRLGVVMSHPREDVQIRYTLDDTYPTHHSPLYTAPITIERTTPVRASAFEGGRKLAVRDAIIFTRVDKSETSRRKRQR